MKLVIAAVLSVATVGAFAQTPALKVDEKKPAVAAPAASAPAKKEEVKKAPKKEDAKPVAKAAPAPATKPSEPAKK
jgi:hypothetical protein